jgi:hypothetical protein
MVTLRRAKTHALLAEARATPSAMRLTEARMWRSLFAIVLADA